ncbi:MAG: transcription termination/antitermination protein NusA [Solobacterium sp.]|nr:transcription termination/antitermination protein NusA [Solobacterium sp.]
MELKYKDMLKALAAIEDERKIPEEDLKEALKEALAKAYKKDAELSDINVEVEINEKSQTIDIYQLYNVVENVEDDELEIELPEARELKPDAILGDVIRRKVEITGMSRAAALLARNVIRQKIREAEKIAVYNAYIDQLDEMVIGIVETVKEKFTLVNLGKTIAMMPKSNQIPNEHLTEGQKIRVVITEVNTDTKGSQVLVSRASPMLVKRLFEKEVPEISQGIVEIKAIAREAGERTKMAVVSYNPDIDPTGACIGQRGARVQEIIEELKGEKIDIFQWSEDFTVLVKNALAPAEIINVLPGPEDHSLTVIVDDDQLSLAIGKKGKNARLAVKLTGRKIDIKTRADIEATYGDYDKFVAEAEVRKEELQRQISQREIARMEAEKKAADEKRQAAIEELARRKADEAAAAAAAEDVLPEEMQEMMSERIRNEMAHETHPAETPVQETPAVEEEVSEPEAVAEEAAPEVTPEPAAEEPKEEPVEEPAAAKEPKKKKVDLEEIAAKHEYVSKFEKFADTSKPKPAAPVKKRRKKGDDDGIKTRNDELLKQLTGTTEIVKPVYTEEELDEIERQQQEEEYSKYDDIDDYDEYEEYYDN